MNHLFPILILMSSLSIAQNSNIYNSPVKDKLKAALNNFLIEEHNSSLRYKGSTIQIDTDDRVIISCNCIKGKFGDLNDPITGKECPHGTNPSSGISYWIYYPEEEIITGDLNNDGLNDYILNYTLEGFGGGNAFANYDILILGGNNTFKAIDHIPISSESRPIKKLISNMSHSGIITSEKTSTLYPLDNKDENSVKTTKVTNCYILNDIETEIIRSSSIKEENISEYLKIYKNNNIDKRIWNLLLQRAETLLSDLKYCRKEKEEIWSGGTDELNILLPICQMSDEFKIHLIAPNYLIIQPKSAETCGSGGCSIDIFKFQNNTFTQIGKSIFSDLISNECSNDFIVEKKNVKVFDGTCNITVKRKFTVIDDKIKPLDFDVDHTIIKTNLHKETCDWKEIMANPNSAFHFN
jgi:hypothetical protein